MGRNLNTREGSLVFRLPSQVHQNLRHKFGDLRGQIKVTEFLYIHNAIKQISVIHTIRTSSYLGAIINALHADIDDGDFGDINSISAILKGNHPDQVKVDQGIAQHAPIKIDSPLLSLV